MKSSSLINQLLLHNIKIRNFSSYSPSLLSLSRNSHLYHSTHFATCNNSSSNNTKYKNLINKRQFTTLHSLNNNNSNTSNTASSNTDSIIDDAVDNNSNSSSTGNVAQVKRGLAYIEGLEDELTIHSKVYFTRENSNGNIGSGIVLSLESGSSTVLIIDGDIEEGDIVTIEKSKNTNKSINGIDNNTPPAFPVNLSYVGGKIFDPLGNVLNNTTNSLDSNDSIQMKSIFHDNKSLPLLERSNTYSSVITGIKQIDLLNPLTQGARLGFIGASGSGKLRLSLDIGVNTLKNKQIDHVVYCCIGKSKLEFNQVLQQLNNSIRNSKSDLDLMQQISIIYSNSNSSLGSLYLTPFSAVTLASSLAFQENKNVLIIYDSMSFYANIVNQINSSVGYPLLSYNYLISNVLEYSAKSNNNNHNASLTGLCLIEQNKSDKNIEIIENLASFVDYSIYFDSKLSSNNIYPAINSNSIIARPNSKYRSPLFRNLTHKLSTLILLSDRTFNQSEWAKEFGFEVEEEDFDVINYKQKLQLLLTQFNPNQTKQNNKNNLNSKNSTVIDPQISNMSVEYQLLTLITATNSNLLAPIELEDIQQFESFLHSYIETKHKKEFELLQQASKDLNNELSLEILTQLETLCDNAMQDWKVQQARKLHQ